MNRLLLATWHHLGNNDHDLGCTNVETDYQIFVFFCHMFNRSCLYLQSTDQSFFKLSGTTVLTPLNRKA